MKVCKAILTPMLPMLKVCIIVLCISTTLLISACEPSNDLSKPMVDTEKEHVGTKREHSISRLKIPASKKDEIEAVYGWLDSTTILYGEKKEGTNTPQLMVWNMKTNVSDIFYQPASDFKEVSISPSGDHVMISSFTSSGKASLIILDRTGNPQYSIVIPAYELAFDWNAYEEGQLLVTSFYEDWTYSSYVINAENQTVQSLDFPQPFAQWDSEDGLMFLDWDRNEPALTAPLKRKALNDGAEENLMLDVIHFKKVKTALMTIQVETEKKDRGTYSFYDDSKKSIQSFSVPLLKSFSDWVIPAYDLLESNKELVTFVPVESKDADQYENKFTLTKMNWVTGAQEELMKDMENEPLSCSFDGNLCLYGNQFEKIIDLKTHQIKKIF